jgi:hypothetical protein
MQTVAVKQTDKSIKFNTIINLFINQNFNCKVEFDEQILASGTRKNLVLPPILKLDNQEIDLDIYDYVGAATHIVEFVLGKNKVKPNFKTMEYAIITSFLSTLYNALLLEAKDIQSIRYLQDNCDITYDDFSGFIIYAKQVEKPKEVTEVKTDFPALNSVKKSDFASKSEPLPEAKTDDFVTKPKRVKNKKSKQIISLESSVNELLLRGQLSNSREVQEETYNGWSIKIDDDKKCTAVNRDLKLYIPIIFNLTTCINEARENKTHGDWCKYLFCKLCHDAKAVNIALDTHNRIVKNGNFTEKQIAEDLHCRVMRANTFSRCKCDVHDFVSLLENLAEEKIPKQFMLNETQYNELLNKSQKK